MRAQCAAAATARTGALVVHRFSAGIEFLSVSAAHFQKFAVHVQKILGASLLVKIIDILGD